MVLCNAFGDTNKFGEVPKRLKGLPWKGSRSLIAARGFKSLLLRLHSGFYCVVFRMIFRIAVNRNVLNEKNDEKSKKVLTKAEGFGNINFAVARKKE